MSDVISLANQIAATKENIRQAIEDRGVSIPITTPLTDYPAKIAAIDTENTASDLYIKDPNFDPATVNLVIPGNYGTISNGAFENNDTIETVDLQYVNTLCDEVFEGDTALTSVTGNHLKYIGNDTFRGTSSLASFTNNHVKWIGNNAFHSSGVASVSVPNCEVIRGAAFMEADNLETVDISSAKNIPSECFYGCNILNDVSADSAKSIGAYAFNLAGNGAYSTYGTTYSLSFPNVESLGMGAFQDSNGLTSISLPKCLTIGNAAFYDCNNLSTINCTKVTDIEPSAFDNTNAIYTLNCPECSSIGAYNFYNNPHRLNELTVGDGCIIGDHCFRYGVKKVNGKISRINSYFMSDLDYVGNIEIDIDLSELTYIGPRCFYNSTGGQRIDFKSQVVDLANLTTIDLYDSTRIFYTSNDGYSNVKKLWLRGDLVGTGGSWNGYRDACFKAFNTSTCHVYTDAATKPSNWGNMLNYATWHFGATHEEFEEA